MAITADQASQYGFGMDFLNSVPEVKGLVERASTENWTGQKFEYELRQTSWYRNKTDAQREWSVLLQTQPAEAQRQQEQLTTDIYLLARNMGISEGIGDRASLARQALENGWSESELRWKIAQQLSSFDIRTQAGEASSAYFDLRELAKSYGVDFSPSTLEYWTKVIVGGGGNLDGFREYVKRTAAGQYPSIADELERGLTVDQLFDPYRQAAARVLSVNPAEIDIQDPLYREVFNYRDPGESAARPMTLDEFERTLRVDSRYGYDKTKEAVVTAAQLGAAIQRDFGQRG